MAKIANLKEKLDACQLEKKYFEAFMIESRKENKDLKEQLVQGDKETLEKIKLMAKQDAAKSKGVMDMNKIESSNAKDIPENVSSEWLPINKKQSSEQEALKSNFKYLTGVGTDANSKMLPPQLEL